MKGSLVAVVGLLVVALASWVSPVEAQHRGGKAKAAPAHPPKGVAGKAHPALPKGKAQAKSKVGMPKAAQKKQKPQDSPQAKKDAAKKKEARKDLAKKKEVRKDLAKKKEAKKAGADHDPESISLLHAAHQKLHEADHDYGGHRLEAMRHVGAALGHLGSSSPGDIRSGSGHMPQQRSDAIMREARTRLQTIGSRLTSGTAKSSHHGEVRSAVERAIREVDQALAVR